MANISVKKISEQEDTASYQVIVEEGASSTQHEVSLNQSVYERYCAAKVTPEQLIEKSFEFLLEREPKESILAHFALEIIERYFPEYPAEIKKQTAAS